MCGVRLRTLSSDNFDTRDPTATKEDLKNLDNHYQMRISQEANSLVMQNFGGLYSGDAESFMLEHIIEGRNMNEMHLNFNDEKKNLVHNSKQENKKPNCCYIF